MRVKKKTIILAKVRKQIRNAIDWNKVDDGMPHFYKTKNYIRPGKVPRSDKGHMIGNYPYYTRSDKAIEKIAQNIYKIVKGLK